MSIEHAWAVTNYFGILFEAVGMIAGDMVLGISRGKQFTILVGNGYFLCDCVCDSFLFLIWIIQDRETSV